MATAGRQLRATDLRLGSPDAARRIRDVLTAAEYTEDGIAAAVGKERFADIRQGDIPRYLRRRAGKSPLDILVQLFLLSIPADAGDASRALAPTTLDDWAEAGLVNITDGRVHPLVQLHPHGDLVLAADVVMPGQPLPPDVVMGVGDSSATLGRLTVRRPVGLALDLGTGGGVHALLAASHSERVIGTDTNARALSFAQFNAELNQIENVEWREGDLFEPVRDERFGLIVSNPPFVVSPESRYTYRDSGMPGDQLAQRIVREAAGLLEEGGFCQLLCSWVHEKGEPWQERLARWFEGSGCDAWVMPVIVEDPGTYAAGWIRDTEMATTHEAATRLFDQWIAYYDEQRVEAISTGLVTMRRRSGADNWFGAEEGPRQTAGPAGDDILVSFAARDFLETATAVDLLQVRLRVSPDVHLEQRCAPSDEGWAVLETKLTRSRGLAYSVPVDARVADMVVECDGTKPLGLLMRDMAADTGADLDRLAPQLLQIVAQMVERGFLLLE